MAKKLLHKITKRAESSAKQQKSTGTSQLTSADVPRITNESVAQHREEVLRKARKRVASFRHSRRSIVKLSIGIVSTALVIFFVMTSFALYKFQSTSAFMYGVTRVIPFPIAWADGRLVSYESYLFELRHYMHYYQSQQDVNFATEAGKRRLLALKERSLEQATNRAYVAKLADEHGVYVLPQEVNAQVAVAREQNRLGASDAVFQSVLKEFWGWSVADFKHELRLELLEQKVAAKLDTQTVKRAQDAHRQLVGGADFAKLAAKVSDDETTKADGGEFGFPITESSRDISSKLIDALFGLKQGQHSKVIDTGYALEIVKVLKIDGDKIEAAHIVFNYKDISEYVTPLRREHKPKMFISLN